MKLEIQKGELMLPNDFTFDIQVTNPIFSNEGAASIATTLPATNENCKLLGRPERLARSQKPVRKFPAVLKHGVFQKKCSMIIGGCSRSKGIEASLAFHESELYADFKGKEMKDIFETKKVTSSDFSLESLYYCMLDLYSGYYTSPDKHTNFAIFPVAIEKSDEGVNVLNETTSAAFAWSERNIVSNGDTFSVPDGYGITPFLWLHRAVRLLFELSGYQVVRNDFEKAPFSLIVLVNNCSDTFCNGPEITFRDLVPSVKVEEFILWLYDRFGAVVAVNGKSVRILMQQNALSAFCDENLSGYLRGTPTISYPIPSRVVLGCDTSLESAEPAAESLPSFRSRHSIVRSKDLGEDPEANGVIFREPVGKYYLITNYGNNYDETLLGSNCFPYDRDNSEETEDYAAADRFLPEIVVGDMIMPYIGDRIHYNTSIANRSEESQQPIQVCYALWSSGKWFGTPLHYNYAGGQIGYEECEVLPDLTPEGLYSYCWSRYNELLLNGAPKITAQIDYPLSLLMSMDICTPKFLNGVKVMIESFSYQVSPSGIKCGESILRLIPSYQDQIRDEEVMFSEGACVWKLVNTLTETLNGLLSPTVDYNIINQDTLNDYTMADAPFYTPGFAGIVAKRRTRWMSVDIVDLIYGSIINHCDFEYEEYFISVREDSN